jgi:predicted transcriptional regulator
LKKELALGQPEVSIVMRQLRKHDWITEREEKNPGKGRPYKIYSLKVGFNNIIEHLEEQKKKAVDEMQERIKLLKKTGEMTCLI